MQVKITPKVFCKVFKFLIDINTCILPLAFFLESKIITKKDYFINKTNDKINNIRKTIVRIRKKINSLFLQYTTFCFLFLKDNKQPVVLSFSQLKRLKMSKTEF